MPIFAVLGTSLVARFPDHWIREEALQTFNIIKSAGQQLIDVVPVMIGPLFVESLISREVLKRINIEEIVIL